jgi:hypothetical protein
MGKPKGLDIPVATPDIGGVTLRRHILDREAASLAKSAQIIGRRVRRWLREMPETRPAMRLVGNDDKGFPIFEPWMVDAPDGSKVQLLEPVVPDKDVREAFDVYSKTILGLLKEQTARAKLKPGNGAPPVDDATFQRELAALAKEAVLSMPRSELEALLKQRPIDVEAPSASPAEQPVDEREAVDVAEHVTTGILSEFDK